MSDTQNWHKCLSCDQMIFEGQYCKKCQSPGGKRLREKTANEK